MIDEDPARRDLEDLVDDLAAHREMHDDEIAGMHIAEHAPVRAHINDSRLCLDRVRERLEAPVADLLAKREHVIAHRVARCEHRMELVNPHFAGAQPITA